MPAAEEKRTKAERSRPCGQLVQVPGGVDLGGEDAIELLGVQRLDRAVGERPGAVDHRAQRVLGGDRGEQLLQRLAIGDVAGGDRRLGAQLLELCLQLRRALGLGAAAADQEQVAGAVALGQVAGGRGRRGRRWRR